MGVEQKKKKQGIKHDGGWKDMAKERRNSGERNQQLNASCSDSFAYWSGAVSLSVNGSSKNSGSELAFISFLHTTGNK